MAAAAVTPRAPRSSVALSTVELLHHEFVAHLLRNHDDGRYASEELFAKLEHAGYSVGKRYAER